MHRFRAAEVPANASPDVVTLLDKVRHLGVVLVADGMELQVVLQFFTPPPGRGRVFPVRVSSASSRVPYVCALREFVDEPLPLALAPHFDSVFRTDQHHIVASGGASGKAMGIVAAVRKILERGVEGQAIEALQLFDR
jgi:hypothetical protein